MIWKSRQAARLRIASIALLTVPIGACDLSPAANPVGHAIPAEISDESGAVCGMYVRDQPAPRAQVLHRDGTLAFLCSLGDMLVHLSAPSAHGASQRAFVEVMEPDEDPLLLDNGPHAWIDAKAAHYVVGVPRQGTMGPPVLAYRDLASAGSVANGHDNARVLSLDELKQWWSEQL